MEHLGRSNSVKIKREEAKSEIRDNPVIFYNHIKDKVNF